MPRTLATPLLLACISPGMQVHSDPAPPPAPGAHEIAVSAGEMATRLQKKMSPVYPASAIQLHISGTVDLSVLIGHDGRVKDVREISGPPMLVPAAVTAVRHWRYKAVQWNGSLVDVRTVVHVNFPVSQ